MRETESLRVVDRECAEVVLSWRSSNVQEVIARELDILVEVVDKVHGTQRCIAIKYQRVEQLGNAVVKPRFHSPPNGRTVVSRERAFTDNKILRNKSRLPSDGGCG